MSVSVTHYSRGVSHGRSTSLPHLGQEENSSLEKQLERIDDYCSINGYESAPEYLFTEVMTGVETWRERPELQKLLLKAEQLSKLDETVVVVVDHPDRFARGMDLILLVELLLHYGVHVEFVQTKFEDTDEGHLILHLESYSSKKEWNRIKKRTEDGRRDRVTKVQEKIEKLRMPDPTLKEEIPIEIKKKQIEDEISEYVDLLHTAKTDATKKKARGWIAHLENQLQEIEEKENFLLGIRNNWEEAMKELKRFENWCVTWRDKLDEASYEDKRTCLRHLGISVRIFKYGVRPRWIIDYMPPNILEKLAFVSGGSRSPLPLVTSEANI